ncbi:hypothetical protein IOD16_02355 [Saccharothrix sp. 6-C]|uniref:hypothetical protein n=1 Tax=Saccharothrix sp. 6-C TaxID=2781735 RepID=UPI001917A2E5|nr:hypothetical protein [Saccharothrix sp. 6-C]QQQ77404.1 hypothetical protein IOD16_02355 [Saccharothrix sp. 6-C]
MPDRSGSARIVGDAQPQIWTPPAPRELPALRAALAEYLRSPLQLQTQTQLLQTSTPGTLRPNTGDPARDARLLLEQERTRLAEAVLYYVTEDMTRLALAAATTLPVHSFHPDDVPTESGFLVFAEPIAAYHPEPDPEQTVTIVAVSWGPLAAVVRGGQSGVWLTFWSMTDYEADAAWLHRQGMPLQQARARIRQVRAELTWDNEVALRYGASTLAVVDHHEHGTVVHKDRLDTPRRRMGHDQGHHRGLGAHRAYDLAPDDPGRCHRHRRTASAAQPAPPRRTRRLQPHGVRVVRIRHRGDVPARDDHAAAHDQRTYRVRWTVRGHWRNQWYPSRAEHRPVWINPHVKGPDDAPLRTGDTVHVFDGR